MLVNVVEVLKKSPKAKIPACRTCHGEFKTGDKYAQLVTPTTSWEMCVGCLQNIIQQMVKQ